MLAALPAVLMAVYYYGLSALGVVALSISSAMFWEVLFNRLSKRPDTVGDGSAALIGMIFAMMMPPVAPWWMVIVGTRITSYNVCYTKLLRAKARSALRECLPKQMHFTNSVSAATRITAPVLLNVPHVMSCKLTAWIFLVKNCP